MKKVLLGTTALAAVGLLASNVAIADDEMMEAPVTVGIAGYTTGAIGFASDSNDTQRGNQIDYVFEFAVSGSTTLDNGLTVAVSAQLGQSSGSWDRWGGLGNGNRRPEAVFDEQHITMSGSFGSLRLGRTESAASNATIFAPGGGIGGMFNVNYGWFSIAAGGINNFSGIGGSALEDSIKVVYTSPNFNGLTIGLSYAPEMNEQAPFAGRTIGDGMGGHTAVGLTYSTDFMEGGSLNVGAAFETAEDETGGADPEATKFGMTVGIDQLSFGGGMYDPDGGNMSYDVGASWTEGAYELGLQYANDGADGSVAAANLTYTLGPGVLVGAHIAGGSPASGDDVTQFMLGTTVFF